MPHYYFFVFTLRFHMVVMPSMFGAHDNGRSTSFFRGYSYGIRTFIDAGYDGGGTRFFFPEMRSLRNPKWWERRYFVAISSICIPISLVGQGCFLDRVAFSVCS